MPLPALHDRFGWRCPNQASFHSRARRVHWQRLCVPSHCREVRPFMLTRRDMLRTSGAAVLTSGLCGFPFGWRTRADVSKKRLLVYTRSQTFEHDPVRLGKRGEPSMVDRFWSEQANQHGFEVECTKDGRIFLPETLARFDAFFFYTT